jgi:hypothetical protein
MENPASMKDMERFGLTPKVNSLYTHRNCQCSEEYIVECRGAKVAPRKVKTECPFCHGPLGFKTEYEEVEFHFLDDESRTN